MISKNQVTFKAMHDTFMMTIPKTCHLSNPIHSNVVMKIYTYMMMYNHINTAKKTYNLTTNYDAVRIDFHDISVKKSQNIPVNRAIIVKCDPDDYEFNQYTINKIFTTYSRTTKTTTTTTTPTTTKHSTSPQEPKILRYIPMSYDIYNEKMEPYGYCSQNLTIDFTPTQFIRS